MTGKHTHGIMEAVESNGRSVCVNVKDANGRSVHIAEFFHFDEENYGNDVNMANAKMFMASNEMKMLLARLNGDQYRGLGTEGYMKMTNNPVTLEEINSALAKARGDLEGGTT